ncbi:hypothetical protein [Brevibacillus agri]|uniref:hypothetical protein n=1 Tax=Brevibacillus agri TaxID=51101 RepID=UPI003D1F15AA
MIKDSERLVADLSKAYRAVTKQTTIPILTGFHLQFTGESLTITDSDTDNTCRVSQNLRLFLTFFENSESRNIQYSCINLTNYFRVLRITIFGSCPNRYPLIRFLYG